MRFGAREVEGGAPAARFPAPSTICANPPEPNILNWNELTEKLSTSAWTSGVTSNDTALGAAEGVNGTPAETLRTGIPDAPKAEKESPVP